MATMLAAADPTDTRATVSASSWGALALLFVVYALNYLDRTLIYILFKPIKAEMALTDLELALLGSTSFVLFYTLLGVPFGRLADRVSRRKMIAVGLAVWSIASGCTGLMTDFAGLFLCRVMVGVGEATLAPAALSLLSDLFPARLRATAGALYSAGIPLGAGLALGVGGRLGESMGWRPAFWLLGFPGVALALAVLALPEPRRGATEAASGPAPSAGALLADPVLWLHVLGYAAFAVASNALSMWIPGHLSARFGLGLAEVGAWTGAAAVLGGLAGSALGGAGADRMERRAVGGRLAFGAGLAAIAALAWVAAIVAPAFPVAIGAVFVLMAVGLAWLGPAAADVQDLAGPALRGTAIGGYLFVVNAVGHGLGPPVIGAVNDALGAGAGLWLCPAACAVAAALLGAASAARARRA